MEKIKVIFDTDIGDDIDDAFALALLKTFENVELLGVTTVYRNTLKRAQQVKKLFDVLGCSSIPVHAGIGQPLKEEIHYFEKDIKNEFGEVTPSQYDDSYAKYQIDGTNAIEFIKNEVLEFPDEIIIVAVGPLTNLGTLLKQSPEIASKIKKVVIMGGSFSLQIPEWNIVCDPEAADILFKSGVKVECVGLDVTMKCALDPLLLEDLKKRTDQRSQLLSTWFLRWENYFKFGKSVMHDPLAVATLVSDVCTFELSNIKVDLENKRGVIQPLPMNDYTHTWVASSVNPTQFYQLFKEKLLP